MVLFEYQPGRDGQSPKRLLKDYRGYLQADGYSVYEWFDTQPGITLMQCMAHARRGFAQALDNDRPRAAYVLSQFGKLYDIERKAREQNMTDAQRLALRQQHAVDILTDIGEWLKKEIGQVLPKSPIGKAIAYTLARWDKLCLYTEDGMLEIDNNLVENAIRALALGRRNYLFAGSHEAAQRIAMFYSFFGTCTRNKVEPYTWLKTVLATINDYPINRIEELLPTNKKLFGPTQS